MVRPNNKRLEIILSNCTESVKKLEIARIKLSERKTDSTRTDITKEHLEAILELIDTYQDVFRANAVNLFTSIEEYIAMSLRQSHISVSSKSVADCLKSCKENNYISEEFCTMHLKSLRYRNNIVHRYNEPTSKELQEWWELNRKYYLDFLDFIVNKSEFRDALKQMLVF